MEKLSKEMEENLERLENRAFLKDGKRRKGKAGGNKRKKLRVGEKEWFARKIWRYRIGWSGVTMLTN